MIHSGPGGSGRWPVTWRCRWAKFWWIQKREKWMENCCDMLDLGWNPTKLVGWNTKYEKYGLNTKLVENWKTKYELNTKSTLDLLTSWVSWQWWLNHVRESGYRPHLKSSRSPSDHNWPIHELLHIASYPYFGQSHVVYADELFQQGFGERISTGCQIFYELYGLPEALESGSDCEVWTLHSIHG